MEPPTHIIDPNGDVLIILTNPRSCWEQNASSASQPEADPTFLCSEKALISASPVFRRSLDGSWASPERIPGQPRRLEADGFDEEALWKVLQTIHLNGRLPPDMAYNRRPLCSRVHLRPMNITLLAEVARVVDYYGCIDAMSEISKVWFADLALYGHCARSGSHTTIESYYPDLFVSHIEMLVFVAWAFRQPVLFESVTGLAVASLKWPLEAEAYPIPQPIVDAVNEKRRNMIRSEIGVLRAVQGHLLSFNKHPCSRICASGLLDLFEKLIRETGLVSAASQDPCGGFSYQEIHDKVREISWSKLPDNKRYLCPQLTVACTLRRTFDEVLEELGPREMRIDMRPFVHGGGERQWGEGYNQWEEALQKHKFGQCQWWCEVFLPE
ncbi:hypothetical protein VUR80DRAFT_4263 [Thermomyces stellatus]